MAKKNKSKSVRKRKLRSGLRPSESGGITAFAVEVPAEEALVNRPIAWSAPLFLGLCFFVGVLVYAYWPTLRWVVAVWQTEPDYSHGFLVVPLALLILHNRADWFPGVRKQTSKWGLSLIVLAILMRFSSRLVYADFLDGWSIVPLLAGVVWYLWGIAAMKWALPAVVFLLLMIPMPYQAESLLSWKLQGIATHLSTVLLRVFGQPAVSEGHVVWIHGERLMIEQACSGLRIFVGVGALAYFWASVANRSWIDKIVILASAIPLAVFANSVRITAIGLLNLWFLDDRSRHVIHDVTGMAMIPFAFILLWLIKIYWEHLYHPVSKVTAKDFLPREPALDS